MVLRQIFSWTILVLFNIWQVNFRKKNKLKNKNHEKNNSQVFSNASIVTYC
jgi:hypothetical protein